MSCGGKVTGCSDVAEKNGSMPIPNSSVDDGLNVETNRGTRKGVTEVSDIKMVEWNDSQVAPFRSFTLYDSGNGDKFTSVRYETPDGEILLTKTEDAKNMINEPSLTVYGRDVPLGIFYNNTFESFLMQYPEEQRETLRKVLGVIQKRDRYSMTTVNLPILTKLPENPYIEFPLPPKLPDLKIKYTQPYGNTANPVIFPGKSHDGKFPFVPSDKRFDFQERPVGNSMTQAIVSRSLRDIPYDELEPIADLLCCYPDFDKETINNMPESVQKMFTEKLPNGKLGMHQDTRNALLNVTLQKFTDKMMNANK